VLKTSESYYDDVIAPKLRELASDAHAHGMNFIALVEWEPGDYGETTYFQENQGLAMQMARWAAKAHGNADAFWIQVQRYAEKHGHRSMVLHQQGFPENPAPEKVKAT
jgi:nicotinamidase-related amidase